MLKPRSEPALESMIERPEDVSNYVSCKFTIPLSLTLYYFIAVYTDPSL